MTIVILYCTEQLFVFQHVYAYLDVGLVLLFFAPGTHLCPTSAVNSVPDRWTDGMAPVLTQRLAVNAAWKSLHAGGMRCRQTPDVRRRCLKRVVVFFEDAETH